LINLGIGKLQPRNIAKFEETKQNAMKKHDFEMKALKYSALAGSLTAFAGTAGAQIMYTDVSPDETYTEDEMYMLDVNNDATFDFGIIQFDTVVMYGSFSFPSEGVVLLTAGSNAAMSTSGQVNYLTALNLNDVIDNTQIFSNGTSSSPLIAGAYIGGFANQGIGPWIDAVDHYMGLSFLAGSDFHYGWCRMNLAANGKSFVIKDYAYESTPQTGLLAGQTVNNISELVSDAVSMQVINNTVQLNVLNNTFTNGNVQVINIAGQSVFTASLNTDKNIDLNGYASGVYVISVSFDQGQVNHKLFVR
jgi:hypothetical protein